MSDTIQVKLPKSVIPIHLPPLSTGSVEVLYDRDLSDGDFRVTSDGETRVVWEGEYLSPEIIPIKIPNGVIPVLLED